MSDNERAIENAARDRHIDPNHEVFSGRGFGGANEYRIMEAIYAISSSLLNFETPDLGFPEVSSVFANFVHAETATDPAPLEMVETIINLKPPDQWRKGLTPTS